MDNLLSTKQKNSSYLSSNKTTKNGKIEFLRFFFSIIIVIHHSRSFLGDEISPFLGGSLGVEFFFFVSGYLMMSTIEKKNKLGPPEYVGRETVMYIKKKWISVLPESLISWFLAFGILCIAENHTLTSAIAKLINGIWEPIFITMTGLGRRGVNGVVWYISAMLICMAILYPLLRKYPDVTLHIIIPLTSLCIFGYFFKNFSSVRGPTNWLGWTYKGVLRAFAELGIGCWLFYLAKYIKKYNYTILGRFLISLTENIIYISITIFMYIMGANKYDYFFVAIMAVAVALTFSGTGIDSNLFNSKLVMFLGRFSVPLYFSHTFWASALNYYVPVVWRISHRMAVYLALSIVTASLVMWMAYAVRKYGPKICQKIKRYFINDTV